MTFTFKCVCGSGACFSVSFGHAGGSQRASASLLDALVAPGRHWASLLAALVAPGRAWVALFNARVAPVCARLAPSGALEAPGQTRAAPSSAQAASSRLRSHFVRQYNVFEGWKARSSRSAPLRPWSYERLLCLFLFRTSKALTTRRDLEGHLPSRGSRYIILQHSSAIHHRVRICRQLHTVNYFITLLSRIGPV